VNSAPYKDIPSLKRTVCLTHKEKGFSPLLPKSSSRPNAGKFLRGACVSQMPMIVRDLNSFLLDSPATFLYTTYVRLTSLLASLSQGFGLLIQFFGWFVLKGAST